jgi:uncharacterized protein (DUF2225 family)
MITIEKIEGIKIKPPKLWHVLIFVLCLYYGIKGDFETVKQIGQTTIGWVTK